MSRTHRHQRYCFAPMEGLEDRLCPVTSLGWDGVGLGSANLTYYISKLPTTVTSVTQAQVESAIEAALQVWSSVVDVTFTETSTAGLSDSIDFSFKTIDGSGSTLAYAYFPDDVNPARIAGDVVFDSAETWEVGDSSSAAFDLMLVAVHEIGHSLGLDHSTVTDSIMEATIAPTDSFTSLSSTDKSAILTLYAAADGSTNSTPTDTNTDTDTDTTPTTPSVPTTPIQLPRFNRRFPRWWSAPRRF
jgi:hypothetical protein